MWIVYKTTNIKTLMIYIGVHKQLSSDFDGYLGSGKYFRRSVKFHGKENFIRETLFTFSKGDNAYDKEKELVTKDFVSRRDTYNLQEGGIGGYKKCHTIEAWIKRRSTNVAKYGHVMGQCYTEDSIYKINSTLITNWGSRMGMCHTPYAIEKRNRVKKLNGTDQCRHLNSGELGKLIREKSVRTKRLKGTYIDMAMHKIDRSKISIDKYDFNGTLLNSYRNDRDAEKDNLSSRQSIKFNRDPEYVWVPCDKTFSHQLELKLNESKEIIYDIDKSIKYVFYSIRFKNMFYKQQESATTS